MTDEDIEFLNRVDQGYIDTKILKVVHVYDEGLSLSPQKALEDSGDYLAVDAQGYDNHNE